MSLILLPNRKGNFDKVAPAFFTPHVLARLGCDVTTVNCHPNGIFSHDVEPVEANLGDLMRAVIETKTALGVAHDGTEPKIRLSAEANNEARVHQIYENDVQAIRYFLREESK